MAKTVAINSPYGTREGPVSLELNRQDSTYPLPLEHRCAQVWGLLFLLLFSSGPDNFSWFLGPPSGPSCCGGN